MQLFIRDDTTLRLLYYKDAVTAGNIRCFTKTILAATKVKIRKMHSISKGKNEPTDYRHTPNIIIFHIFKI